MTPTSFNQVKLSNLAPYPGSRHRRKILGRGEGSGHGQTSTRGQKGQGSRSGDSRMMGFEGGQTPLLRRIPKRGFNNARFKKAWVIVNLSSLESHFSAGDTVTLASLLERGLVKADEVPVKVLGGGVLNKKLVVQAHAVSASARQAIEKIGGTIEILPIAK